MRIAGFSRQRLTDINFTQGVTHRTQDATLIRINPMAGISPPSGLAAL